jgi:hypothetical protein
MIADDDAFEYRASCCVDLAEINSLQRCVVGTRRLDRLEIEGLNQLFG